MGDMQIKDWIMVAAVILGPILAVQVQINIERFREKRRRQLGVFQTLMATRASRLSYAHVEALNMIDIEFYGRKIFGKRFQSAKYKAVTNAWKNYNDHLNNKGLPDNLAQWSDKGLDLFVQLLYQMSKTLDYDFDEVQLKRDCYSPIAHEEREEQDYIIRKGMTELFENKRPLPLIITNLNTETNNNGNHKTKSEKAD